MSDNEKRKRRHAAEGPEHAESVVEEVAVEAPVEAPTVVEEPSDLPPPPDAPSEEPKPEEKKPEQPATVEEHARKRGMLPMFIPAAPIRVNQLGAVREIQPPPVFNPEHWKFAAAKALRAWPENAEVSEEEFEKAIDEATNQRIG